VQTVVIIASFFMLKNAAKYTTFLLVVLILYHVPIWFVSGTVSGPFFEVENLLLSITSSVCNGIYFVYNIILLLIYISFIKPKAFRYKEASLGVYTDQSLIKEAKFDKSKKTKEAFLYKFKLIRDFSLKKNNKIKSPDKITAYILLIFSLIFIYLFARIPSCKFIGGLTTVIITQAVYQVIEAFYELPCYLLNIPAINKKWVQPLDHISLLLLLYLPINAIIAGYSESQSISHSKEHQKVCAVELDITVS
jgi:hypothetical protein